MAENLRQFPPGQQVQQVQQGGEEGEETSGVVPPLLPPPHLMSNMMAAGAGAGPAHSGAGQTWPGVASHYQPGFGQSSGQTYPYMYGYRYPHYENTPYWYRGYQPQAGETEPEAICTLCREQAQHVSWTSTRLQSCLIISLQTLPELLGHETSARS